MPNYRGNRNQCMQRNHYGYQQGNQNNRNVCCERDDTLEGMPIGMAYVPWQNWKHIYESEKGFKRGTIFEELDLPFTGKGGCNS